MTVPRILVIGSGGIGSLAILALDNGQAEVTAVARSNFTALRDRGLTVRLANSSQSFTLHPHVLNDIEAVRELPPFDYIVVATKNIPDVSPTTADLLQKVVTSPETVVVLIQNGLNIERPVQEVLPDNIILSGVSYASAVEKPAGEVTSNQADKLLIGPFPFDEGAAPYGRASALDAAKRFVALYNVRGAGARVDCRLEEDVVGSRWRKLIYNAPINTTTAVLQLDIVRLRLTTFVVDDILLPAMREIRHAAAASTNGAVVIDEAVFRETIMHDEYESFFQPSMMQDVGKGSLTEYENIVGEPIREAARHGVATPTLSMLYSLMKAVQWRTKEKQGLLVVPATRPEGYRYC